MLTVQYRMNACIMTWSSEELYGGKLEAHASVATHTLHELSHVKDCAGSFCDHAVLQLIDTSGCDLSSEETEEGGSKMNRGEAAVAMAFVQRLLDSGVKPDDIGVITPYAAQVGLLREMRPESVGPSLEISTVDGFQGREKEAIVISMVRCNTSGEIGFLADKRRMNVAVTRARRQCTLVCNVDTVGADPFLKRLVDYFMDRGEYFSAE
jgi:superfamily I DNA and/or RNA helicase